MKNLATLQQNLQDYLLSKSSVIQQSIVSTAQISAKQRLNIYKEAYHVRLTDALINNYPILEQYLGSMAFQALAIEYIQAHPSTFRSIRWFGDQLPNFLQHTEKMALAELAAFEWKLALCFDAAEAPLLTLEIIAQMPTQKWANMQLEFHPSVQIMKCLWNAPIVWQALADKKTKISLEKNLTEVCWILWRQDLNNRYYRLQQDEAWAIDCALNKGTFSDLCEGLCLWHFPETVGIRAAGLLKGWIQAGLIQRQSVIN